MTRWPTVLEYSEALWDPRASCIDHDLAEATFMENPANSELVWVSGNFAAVARAEMSGSQWAVRLLTRSQPQLEARYRAIEQLPSDVKRYLAETRYAPRAIAVRDGGEIFPVVLVEWIDGTRLGDSVAEACARGDTEFLIRLRQTLDDLRQVLASAGVSHGDISTSNILVTGDSKGPGLKLIDYDSMWFAPIEHLACSIGIGPMQHPRRPNPIGAHADIAAFAIMAVGLDVLIESPELGELGTLQDDYFLVTVPDLIAGTTDLATRFRRSPRGEALVSYLSGDFYAPCEVWTGGLSGTAVSGQNESVEEPTGGHADTQPRSTLEHPSGRIGLEPAPVAESPTINTPAPATQPSSSTTRNIIPLDSVHRINDLQALPTGFVYLGQFVQDHQLAPSIVQAVCSEHLALPYVDYISVLSPAQVDRLVGALVESGVPPRRFRDLATSANGTQIPDVRSPRVSTASATNPAHASVAAWPASSSARTSISSSNLIHRPSVFFGIALTGVVASWIVGAALAERALGAFLVIALLAYSVRYLFSADARAEVWRSRLVFQGRTLPASTATSTRFKNQAGLITRFFALSGGIGGCWSAVGALPQIALVTALLVGLAIARWERLIR